MATVFVKSFFLVSIRGSLLHKPMWKNISSMPTIVRFQTKVTDLHLCHQCRSLYATSWLRKKRRSAEEKKAPRIIQYTPKSNAPTIEIWKNMTVEELGNAIGKGIDHIFEVMMFVDNSVDYTHPHSVIDNWQVIQEVVRKSGMKYRVIAPPGQVKETVEKNKDAVKSPPPDPSVLVKRPPVVTVMGHVDHGKTTLLDALRHTSVVESEFGGITQHIGAFSVTLPSGDTITFLDTPGHAAFSAMRARGAEVTDIVVLVVAADDGVMEQTVESIRMAKEANVPIIVAINKIDKPEADIERSKRMLLQHGIQVEDEGGDVQVVPISALHGTNLDVLAEAIVLQAELMDLKGDPKGMIEGVVIESKTDMLRGKLSTAIVKRGTLRKGTVLVAGTAWAKVRAMFDDQGKPVHEAPPSAPVEVLGWRELPSAGDEILEVESEKRAHEVVKWRELQQMQQKMEADKEVVEEKTEQYRKAYREQLEKKRLMGRFRLKPSGPRPKEIQSEDEGPRVSIIIKGDVDGSVEAILDVLETYHSNSQCKLDLVHYGVGGVTETDIELAEVFGAIIYGFNVSTLKKAQEMANSKKISIRHHNVIYKLIDDLKKEISTKLPEKEVEQTLGEANVLQEFIINEGRKKIPVAGCRCTKGILKKNALYRLVRGEEILYEGSLESMRHVKNEVDSIKKDVECGLRLSDPSIRFQPGDNLVCYEVIKEPQETDWDPGF
ncbi:translation initiation factor IF-2, mitochondrial isoform X1 [Schistocerca piceifrons]|uniref:translation initiation factor IF-2, mitochondrial isoform X1 n=2 Tax=Schistocerca piceifrons TaxID=274613 RepID=UPI001F5E3C97|nr:translation initiation factor IF-2, mitochondrial isoform X1 [Schistocerca piceifrons]